MAETQRQIIITKFDIKIQILELNKKSIYNKYIL